MTLQTTLPRSALAGGLVLAAAVLVGCASPSAPTTSGLAPAPTAAATPAAPAPAATPPAAGAGAVADSRVGSVDLTQNRSAATTASLARFVYFEFDSDTIAQDFKPTIDGHARRLAGERNAQLRIEGHADERGGREYNLALGQRRAEAVARSIVLLGGDASRIETVSFGEERPKAEGSNEEAWKLNRRAELAKR
jgi:peptidoglycan-associated lipoprotein